MAKASRPSKKQPAFDPNELGDLIFSPAVGTGVGSHLVGERFLDVATVDASEMTTVADMTTVNRSNKTTVDTYQPTSEVSTVGSSLNLLWLTEQGELVAPGRVRNIRQAEDALTRAEEAVYNALRSTPELHPMEVEKARFRIVQSGYHQLGKMTGLSKRTIQRIVDRLIEKDFIAIHCHADVHRRASTVYRVFSSRTILDRHAERGRFHIVKLGTGISFAHPKRPQ